MGIRKFSKGFGSAVGKGQRKAAKFIRKKSKEVGKLGSEIKTSYKEGLTEQRLSEFELLERAVNAHDEEHILQLIEDGIFVDVKDENGNTLLMLSSYLADTWAVKVLLRSFGANPNARNDFGSRPLHFAAPTASPERIFSTNERGTKEKVHIIKFLLKAGADIDAQNEDGKTPLMNATSYGNISALIALLNAGADPNVVDNNGESALFSAVCINADDSVKLMEPLIAAGARLDLRNRAGEGIEDRARDLVAEKKECQALVSYLKKKSVKK
ncbi:ankyrin repeat domain-containing protein [Patescibacteria group bacterium]